jgi:transposase
MEDTSDDGFRGVRRLEVVDTGRRRRWSDEVKIRLVEETLESGVSVASVARRHGIAASQIYDWRRKFFPQAAGRGNGAFVPVVVTPERPTASSRGQMEILSTNGRRIVVDRDVDVSALLRVLGALEA